MRAFGLLSFLAILAACSRKPSEAAPHTTEAAPPRVDAASTSSPLPAASSATPVAEAPDAGPPAKPVEEPAPNVKVFSIGMHVAGGPFDEETKKQYLKPVEPHYADLAKCWNKVKDKTRGGDVGVDLLIPPGGGKPKVSNPRSTIEGEGFLPCCVAFFETMEFGKPHSGGLQGVSYSVRFKPGK